MVKKVHIVKSENDIDEVGVQVLSGAPTVFDDKRIYLDKDSGAMFVPKDGAYRKANIQVYAEDPIGELFWINDTENTLKWVVNGTVNTMSLEANNTAMITSLEGFAEVLSQIEEGVSLDIIGSDSSLINVFNTKPSELKNLGLDHSGIKVIDKSTSGTYKDTVKTSGTKNYVEGIVNYQAQAMEPKTITDNGDGSSTIIFDGDMTSAISVTQKFIIFEEVNEEITVDDEFRKFYKETKAKRARQKSFYLLNGLEPAIISATGVSYDMGVSETTVILTNNGLDVSMGLMDYSSLRFMPFNINVKGGSVVDSILLDNLQLVEAYSETSKHPEVLGADSVLNYVRNDIADVEAGHIDWLSVSHSPNKQYWLVWAMVGTTTSTSNRIVIWYSNDGMKSLRKSDFYASASNAGYNVPTDYWTATFDQYTGGQVSSNEANTHISDCGEVVFIHTYSPAVSYFHTKFVTGRLDLPVAEFAYNADNLWSQKSQISFETSGSYNYYCHTSAMDFETGILMASASRNTDDLYFQAWAIDFEKLTGHVIGHTANYVDYATDPFKGFSFWGDFEGERKFFCGQRHVNNYWHCVSVSLYDIISEYRAEDGNHRGGDITFGSAFSTVEVTNGSHNKTRILDEIGSSFILTGYDYSNGQLTVWGADWDNNRNALAIIDFEKAKVIKSEDVLTFDVIPDDGQMLILLGQANLSFGATNFYIDKDDTSESIQALIDDHTNSNCFFSSLGINGELTKVPSGHTPDYNYHLWGKWCRNNFLTRVFTTKSEKVAKGLLIDSGKLLYSNYNKISVATDTGISDNFKFLKTHNFTSADLVLNGTFDTNLDNWTPNTSMTCTASSLNGELFFNLSGLMDNQTAQVTQNIPCVVGKKYVISYDRGALVGAVGATMFTRVMGAGGSGYLVYKTDYDLSTEERITVEFVATDVEHALVIGFSDNGTASGSRDMTVDDVSSHQYDTSNMDTPIFLKINLQDAQGGIRVLFNGTGLGYPKGSANGEYDPNVTLSYFWDITDKVLSDGVASNTIEIKGSASDHGVLRGIEVGQATEKDMGIEFNVFTKAGIDHDVEFRIYEKDGTLKNTIVAGDSASPTDTMQTITIGREYLSGYGDYVECSSKSDSNDLKDCYVRRSQENFIAYSWREWEVTGDFASGFTFKCQRPEPIDVSHLNTFTNNSNPVIETLTNINPFTRQSVVNLPVLNAPYNQTLGCGVWIVGERMMNDAYYNGSVMSTSSNGNRNNFNVFRNGDSILMSFTRHAYSGGQTNSAPFLYKIPDYKEFTVKTLVNTYGIGTPSNVYLTNNDGTDAGANVRYGTRIAQSVVIPALAGANYADGMVPLRTLEIQMSNDWIGGVLSSQGWHYFEDDVFICCKIVRMTAGYPDDTKVLGEAINKVPASELPSYVSGNLDEIYFNFDNLKLTPSSEACIIIYVEGLDIEATPNSFAPAIRTNNAVSTLGGHLFREFQNVWSEQVQSLWFTMFDVYMSDIRFMHEGGWNRNAKVVNPYQDYWRDISETTIYPLKNSTSKFTGTYRNSGMIRHNNRSYSPSHAGSTSYSYSIEDVSQFSPCVVSQADIIEANGNPDYDENLVMAIVPKDKHKARLLDAGDHYKFTSYKTPAPESEEDYHFNRSLTIGGGNLDYASWIDQFRQTDITKYKYGIVKNDKFKYDYAFQLDGTKMYAYYDARVFCPFHREFIWEMEIEPSHQDLDGTQNMLFDSLNLFRITLDNDNRYGVYISSQWTTNWCYTEERCVQEYHRLRVVRSHELGIQIFRNFTKDDENAWELMTRDTTVGTSWTDYAHGRQIGRNDETHAYFAIGGYSNAAGYEWYGKIGYLKYAIGSAEFKADNIVHQDPFVRPANRGDVVLGLKNYYECSDSPTLYKTDLTYMTPKHIKNAFRKSYPQVLKFKKYITNVGTNKTIEIELTKKSDEDVTAVKGMYFDFDRR